MHSRRNKDDGKISPQMEIILPLSPLMLKGRTTLVQEDKVKGLSRDSKKEEKEDASITIGLTTMLESVLTKRILQGMTTTTTTPTSKAMAIKGTTSSTTKERGMLLLLDMEMVVLPKGQETASQLKFPL